MTNQITVESCREWIMEQFGKLIGLQDPGIEVNYFWFMAAKAGVYIPGTFGNDAPMSIALAELCRVESVCDVNGKWCYNVFKRAKQADA